MNSGRLNKKPSNLASIIAECRALVLVTPNQTSPTSDHAFQYRFSPLSDRVSLRKSRICRLEFERTLTTLESSHFSGYSMNLAIKRSREPGLRAFSIFETSSQYSRYASASNLFIASDVIVFSPSSSGNFPDSWKNFKMSLRQYVGYWVSDTLDRVLLAE